MFGSKKVDNMLEKHKDKICNTEFFESLLTEDGADELFDMMAEEKKNLQNTDEFTKAVARNTKLTWLSSKVIPKHISISFKDWVTENKDVLNIKAKVSKMTSMLDILEGSKYVSKNDYENDDTIFNVMDYDAIEDSVPFDAD